MFNLIHGEDPETFEVKTFMKSFVSHWLDFSNSLFPKFLKYLFLYFRQCTYIVYLILQE